MSGVGRCLWLPTRMGWEKEKKKKLPQSENEVGAKDKDGRQSRDRKYSK